jgi:hypothetical protein
MYEELLLLIPALFALTFAGVYRQLAVRTPEW